MDENVQANNSPLCVFCLSPSFSMLPFRRSVTPTPRRRTFTRWRRSECVYPKIRSRFKPSPRRTLYALPKYLAGRLRARKKDISLQEVLYTLRLVWTPKNELKRPTIIDMEDRFRKTSNIAPSEVSSPVMLRRRLSAPETIMRKHMLAQQRSESQESDITQVSDCRSCQWRMNIGSDSNLSRKRDSSFMRKSTLLRKLWSNSKNVLERSRRFSTAYSEWQYSCGKLSLEKSTLSLNSDQSSPEHLQSLKSELHSPKRTFLLANSRKLHSQDLLSGSKSSTSVTKTSYTTTCTTNTPKTVTTESESESTTRRTGTGTTSYSDNSDSAYTNSQSNFSQNSETVYSSETQYAEEDVRENDENVNEVAGSTKIKTDLNANAEYHRFSSERFIKYSNSLNTSATRTSDTANLNVISNVHLSQSTLDLIFNHVLQDVQNKQPNSTRGSNSSKTEEEIQSDAKIIKVQQMPSFYLKRKDDDVPTNPEYNRIIKYMISNVGVGSPYSKPAEVPQIVVPRYSALPRTSSMEVNTSSGDSTDKESDTISLVDSLEDPMSPRGGQSSCVKHDEKPVRGDLSLLLPDNSDQKKTRKLQKPAAFFISIENCKQEEGKAVADHLPAKVREKLSKRHMKRELHHQKVHHHKTTSSPKSDSNYISASDNGNHVFNNSELDDVKNIIKYSKLRGKILPNIQARVDDTVKKVDRRCSKDVKRKSLSKSEAQISKNKTNVRQRLVPVFIHKNQCEETSRKPPSKKDASKRLDFLQVVESVEEKEPLRSNKSKIPVLVQQRLPKLEKKAQKPVYLDFGKVRASDPKIDQLIANILIDTLNKCETHESKPQVVRLSCDKRPAAISPVKTASLKYQQKFEVIPEELSHQSSLEENANKNISKCINGNFTEILANQVSKSTETIDNMNKGTDAFPNESRINDEVFTKEKVDDNTVPQGWITFYMMHKNQGSPDSTSDEGTKKSDNFRTARKRIGLKKEDLERTNNPEDRYIKDSSCDYDDYKVVKSDARQRKVLETMSSSDVLNENVSSSILPIQNGRYKKQFRKCGGTNKEFPNNYEINNFDQWSVTVSGTNSYGQSALDVEMRLKFPQSNKHVCQYQSDSGIGEENDRLHDSFPKRSTHLLKRAKLQQQNGSLFADNSVTAEDNYKNGRLPVISQNPKRTSSKRCDSSVPINSSVPFRVEPRQTKTSTRRYALNRPKNLLSTSSPRLTSEEFLHLNAERQLAAILSRFPEVLSVNGNSISPERKPRVSKMSERDLTRSFYNGH